MKTSVSVTVDTDLLEQAKHLNIDISRVLEESLETRLMQLRERNWLSENKPALDSYARYLEENELFSDEHRSF